MLDSSPISVLLVGFGQMVREHHLPLLIHEDGVEVIGVVRANPRAGTANDLPVYSDLAKALAVNRPDLVIVSTPHHEHFRQARLCLENGCHVLVEKPLALELAEAEALVELADSEDRLLVEGLQRRYEGLASVFYELSAAGALGQIKLVHGLFSHRFSPPPADDWRANPQFVGDGVLGDSAIHLMDLLVVMAGGAGSDLQAQLIRDPNSGGCNSFSTIFTSDQGVLVSATGSYLSPANSVQEEVSILGDEGSLFGRRFCIEHNVEPPLVTYKNTAGTRARQFDLSTRPSGRTLPLQAMLSVLRGQADRRTLLSEARRTLPSHRILELIRGSDQNKAHRPMN